MTRLSARCQILTFDTEIILIFSNTASLVGLGEFVGKG